MSGSDARSISPNLSIYSDLLKRSYFQTAAAAKLLLLSNMTHDILYLLEQIHLIPAPFDTATRDMCKELVTVTHITSVPVKELCFMLFVFYFHGRKKINQF